MNEDQFRQAVLVLSMVQNLVDIGDLAITDKLFKGPTKRKLKLALEALELDCKHRIEKLYETDDVLFQAIQQASQANLEYMLETKIEDIVNGDSD